MVEISEDEVKRLNDLLFGYKLRLAQLGWDRILDAKRIQSDTDFLKSKAIIKAARDIIKDQMQINDFVIGNMYQAVEDSATNEIAKNIKQRHFIRNFGEKLPYIKKSWALEMCILEQVENIITLLANTQTEWVFEEDEMLFLTDDLYDAFSDCMKKVHALSAQQNQLLQHI